MQDLPSPEFASGGGLVAEISWTIAAAAEENHAFASLRPVTPPTGRDSTPKMCIFKSVVQ